MIDYKKSKLVGKQLNKLKRGKTQAVYDLLFDNIDTPMNVTQIQRYCEFDEQSATSQALAILRKSDLVLTQRIGKEIYYRINRSEKIERFVACINELAA